MQIRVHHLQTSRSTRIIWLMEELGLEYELIHHQRDPETARASHSLHAVHPLGRAPLIEIDGTVISESGAIIDYVLQTRAPAKLAPGRAAEGYAAYLEWLHFAEGSAMLPIMILFLARRLSDPGARLSHFAMSESRRIVRFCAESIRPSGYLLDMGFSGADIQMHYVFASARRLNVADDHPQIAFYLDRVESRPAFRKAIEVGGPLFPSATVVS